MNKSIVCIVVLGAFAAIFIQITQANHLNGAIEEDSLGFRIRYPLRRCSNCGPNKCRVVGMQRYSEPICEHFGGFGAPCRMWQEPENKTLHFPNSILECADVYMQHCPCGSGLTCNPESMTCGDQQSVLNNNNDEQNDNENDEIQEAFRPNEDQFPWAVGRFH